VLSGAARQLISESAAAVKTILCYLSSFLGMALPVQRDSPIHHKPVSPDSYLRRLPAA